MGRGRIRTVVGSLGAFAVWGLGACGGGGRVDEHTISTTPTEGMVIGRATLDQAIPVLGHDSCIVPFAIESDKSWFQDNDPFTRGGEILAESRSVARTVTRISSRRTRWHNAVVVDFATDRSTTLLDRRGIISRYSAVRSATDAGTPPITTHWLVFIVTDADSNADGLLNNRDASRVLLSSPDGAFVAGVTPPDGQVWGVTYHPDTMRFFFRVAHDTNGDGRFNDADATLVYTWNREMGNSMATPVVSGELRRDLEQMMR